MSSDTRVTVVIRPLDRALNAAKVVLVPLVALALATPALAVLMRSFAPIVVLAVGAAALLASQSQKLMRPMDRALAGVRRWVATACNHDDWVVDREDHRLACMLTADVFRAPLFQHDRQRRVVSDLRDACGDAPAEHYWFVEGRSGSGKTRTALLLVQNLVRDRKLYELGNRCHLYDFADAAGTQDELVRRLRNPPHDGAVVLVDNFQLVRDDVLRRVTARLVDDAPSAAEHLLVFLARSGEAWSLGSGSDVRLLSEAKERSHYLELTAPSSEAVASRVRDVDQGAAQLLRQLEQDYVASATQLHLAQVIARNGMLLPEVRDVMQLLTDAQSATAPPQLVTLLAVLSALAMHRGWFARRELRTALRAAHGSHPGTAGLTGAVRLWRTFRRLHEIGLVPKIHLDGTRYLFHETLAELCIDRLSGLPAFREPFAAVGRMRLEAARTEGEWLDAWLLGTEIGDQETVEASFDEALAGGRYGRMTRCLERADARYALSAPTRLQLAILLDRTGEFDASREQFTDDLEAALSDSTELAAILATSRLEARHDADSATALAALRTHPDRLLAIVGEYWDLHIAAHQGQFASARMLALASEALELVKGRESHWTTHSLGRMHFDSLRHHYLAGGVPAGEVTSAPRPALDDYLSTRLPTYEAFHTLYARAHLVGHVLLPQLAIYKQPLSEADGALARIDHTKVTTPGQLAQIALDLYRRARDQFWQFGDREGRYLRADVANATMIQDGADLDALVVDLHEYQRFIDGCGFEDIASYPHFYLFRWHMLKAFELLLDERGDWSRADELLERAADALRRVADLDAGVGNAYGMLRAELFTLLLIGLRTRTQPDVAELRALQARAAAHGYGSEERLLRHLAQSGPLIIADLRAIVRFYPFVHQ